MGYTPFKIQECHVRLLEWGIPHSSGRDSLHLPENGKAERGEWKGRKRGMQEDGEAGRGIRKQEDGKAGRGIRREDGEWEVRTGIPVSIGARC